MAAAVKGNPDCVKALIAAGSDVNAKDNDHETALLKAVYVGRTIIKPQGLGVLKAVEVGRTTTRQDFALAPSAPSFSFANSLIGHLIVPKISPNVNSVKYAVHYGLGGAMPVLSRFLLQQVRI